MNPFVVVLIMVASFALMEMVAWFTHKYVMHGVLWNLHKDHHIPSGKKGFQKNDLFVLIFALPGILLIMTGYGNAGPGFWIGIGIALYGLAYLLLHDILVHERFLIRIKPGNAYLRAVYNAHTDHHTGKSNYGFIFMFPGKYFRIREKT